MPAAMCVGTHFLPSLTCGVHAEGEARVDDDKDPKDNPDFSSRDESSEDEDQDPDRRAKRRAWRSAWRAWRGESMYPI